MIIDAHTHIFPPEVISSREKYFTDQAFSLLYNNDKSSMADASILLKYMDESGIDAAVAMSFPWRDAKTCSLHNSYMASVMKEFRGRIYCFGMVPLAPGRDEVFRRAKEIKGAGLAGIGEIGFYSEGFTRENALFLRHLLEAAGREDLPLCLHVNEPVGHMYSGKYKPGLDELYTILGEFREVSVILAHWGGGLFLYELMHEVREALAHVYYDTAATPYLYGQGIYDAAIAAAGADKIIFGSDFPLLRMERYTGAMSSLDPGTRERIMCGNALGLMRRSKAT